jgi:autotransporter passenger strand-loop-strand repeat protein
MTTTSVTSVTSTTSGVTVSSGTPFNVGSGGAVISATILSGGSVTVQVGGSDTGSFISAGGSEEVLGSASGDMVAGVQVVTSGSAIVRDETILNGGTIELLKSGATGSALTVETGGTLDISGAATASNTVVSGGLVDLETAAATIAGTLTFAGSATLEITSVASTGSGALATIGGFTAGDVIDVAFISSGATLTATTSGGNTLATITSGGVTETLTFSGTTIGSSLSLVNAGAAGEEITFAGAPPTSSSTTTSVTTSTASGPFVVSSGMALDVLSGGTIVAALRFEVLEFDREDALHSGQLRAALASLGTHIGPYDVLIAGQAIARGLTLITHNLREFQRAPGRQVEDWEI